MKTNLKKIAIAMFTITMVLSVFTISAAAQTTESNAETNHYLRPGFCETNEKINDMVVQTNINNGGTDVLAWSWGRMNLSSQSADFGETNDAKFWLPNHSDYDVLRNLDR
jgi:hypothetical protein